MAETRYETIIVGREGGTVRLTLNRPEKKNAINGTMFDELGAVFNEVASRPDDRVLVINGAGGAFCSGADLSGGGAAEAATPISPVRRMDHIHDVALALHRLTIPVIASVDGDAVGAGCNLALGCDMVFATSRSRFAQIFVRRGLSVDFGGTWILPRLIGLHRAKLLCLTGDIISAEEAADLGLVNRVVEQDDLDKVVQELVDKLLAGPPVAQALIKRMLNDGGELTMAQALAAESAAQAINSGLSDAAEARRAFMEKRDPVFKGY
jgi:2-(1,2-epoxy-1,2-dihydrophenyl)acetyl-CoA isomerase